MTNDDWWLLHDACIAAWQADRQRLERLFALQEAEMAKIQAILARTQLPPDPHEEAGR